MAGRDLDMQVRLTAFDFLAELVRIHGDVLPAGALRKASSSRGSASG
jgi:hypothetical protein